MARRNIGYLSAALMGAVQPCAQVLQPADLVCLTVYRTRSLGSFHTQALRLSRSSELAAGPLSHHTGEESANEPCVGTVETDGYERIASAFDNSMVVAALSKTSRLCSS